MLKVGKEQYDQYKLGQFKFDVEYQLKYVKSIMDNDPTSAKLILFNKVFALTELFFDIKQLWTPAPKQRLINIKNINPQLYDLLVEFYQETTLQQQINIAESIVTVI